MPRARRRVGSQRSMILYGAKDIVGSTVWDQRGERREERKEKRKEKKEKRKERIGYKRYIGYKRGHYNNLSIKRKQETTSTKKQHNWQAFHKQ